MRASPVDKGLDPLSTMTTPPFVMPPRTTIDPASLILYPSVTPSGEKSEDEKLLSKRASLSQQSVTVSVEGTPTINPPYRPLLLNNPPPAATGPSTNSESASLKSIKFTLDSAASRISKYAQSAAYQIKVMAQTAASENKLSPLATEIPMQVFEEAIHRTPIPPEWIEAYWDTPKNKILSSPSDQLFKLEVHERIQYSFPRAAFICDVRISNDSVKPTPSLFRGGGEMSAIPNEFASCTEASAPPFLLGRALITSHRLFFDPISVDPSSYTQRWLIQSGVISIDWFEIDTYTVSFRPQISPSSSPATLQSPYGNLESFAHQIEAGHCIVDITLRCGTTLCLAVHSADCLPLTDPTESIGPISDTLCQILDAHIRPQSILDYGAFMRSVTDENHLKVFDPVKEYSRYCTSTEVLNDAAFQLADYNMHFTVCPTYPPLLPLPRTVTESMARSVAEFRTRGRLPILAWRDSQTSASLWRSSQPQSAFSRSMEDEYMVCDAIRLNLDDQQKPLIFDARPFVNAVVNKFTGAGFEDAESYANCTIEFASIENIQKVSDSCAAVIRAAYRENTSFKAVEFKEQSDIQDIVIEVEWCQPSNIMSKVYSSGWLDHILTLLRAASRIARHLAQGQVVLVHCSDGWDRTAQLSALAQILIDPYFRTLKGFITLVEKEFVWMGHKFGTRLGHPVWLDRATSESEEIRSELKKAVSKKQISPVFVQWLECVWQIHRQFPEEFEFGEHVLVGLASAVHTSKFGDFMFDNEEERYRMRQKGIVWSSIWECLLERLQNNPGGHSQYQRPSDQISKSLTKILPLDTHVCAVKFWEDYWLRNRPRRMAA